MDDKSTIIVILCLAVYFLPWIVASSRGHRSIGGVAVLNLFLGWTFLGWLVALIWAFSGESARERLAREERLVRLVRALPFVDHQ